MPDGAVVDLTALHIQIGHHRVIELAKNPIAVAYSEDAFRLLTGIDSSIVIKTGIDSSIVPISVLQGSPSNDILSQFFIASKNAKGGLAYPFIVREPNGTSRYSCARSFIAQLAPAGWSESGETREWSIICPKLDGFVGGIDAAPIAGT